MLRDLQDFIGFLFIEAFLKAVFFLKRRKFFWAYTHVRKGARNDLLSKFVGSISKQKSSDTWEW